MIKKLDGHFVVTAGSAYLDIDAYACMIAMAELMNLQGVQAIAYSNAQCNYSVCHSLICKGQNLQELSSEFKDDKTKYIIVDVSDPDFLKSFVPLEQIAEIYDHHVGFEEYWTRRIGNGAHIEFIGAAATMIYREWKKAELTDKMKRSTALLLIAAILDNTLNLTSKNTTAEDIEVFNELCKKENIDEEWCASYFFEVQKSIYADLKNAIFNDVKNIYNNPILPPKVAQLCVWDAEIILSQIPQIRVLFEEMSNSWLLNIIDIKHNRSFFICDDEKYQKGIEKIFDVQFELGVAITQEMYLRKEIIKKTIFG